MLTREEKQEIKIILTKKAEINANIEHNKTIVRSTEERLKDETDEGIKRLAKIHIGRGEGIISTQKKEVLMLSARKIAKIMGVDRNQVRHQQTLFNGERVVL